MATAEPTPTVRANFAATQSPAANSSGRHNAVGRIGPWQLVRLLNESDLARVYLARPADSGSGEQPATYVLKVLRREWWRDPQAIEMQRRAAWIGGKISHPPSAARSFSQRAASSFLFCDAASAWQFVGRDPEKRKASATAGYVVDCPPSGRGAFGTAHFGPHDSRRRQTEQHPRFVRWPCDAYRPRLCPHLDRVATLVVASCGRHAQLHRSRSRHFEPRFPKFPATCTAWG